MDRDPFASLSGIETLKTRYGSMRTLANDSVICHALRTYGEWAEHEIATLASLIEDGDAIVDVGANIGTHTLAFARRFPRSRIVAIEPQPLLCALLATNVIENDLPLVQVLNAAASDETSVVNVEIDYPKLDWNTGALSLERFRAADGAPIVTAPLDTLCQVRPVSLIKIDVEGMEPAVLRGAREILKEDRPVVFFEVLTLAAAKEPEQQLRSLDYDLYWLETWPFNQSNFNANAENIWSACELGILAIPKGSSPAPNLVRVTGSERELPKVLNPRTGYSRQSS